MSQGGDLSLAATGFPAAPGSPLGERFAATPRHVCEALARALTAGDSGAALACFCPDACLIGADGTAAHGAAAIHAGLRELIGAGAQVRIDLYGVVVAGEVAIASERWSAYRGGAPDPRTAQVPTPTLVLRRIREEWRIAIAAPWGLPASAPLEAIGMSS